MPIILPDLLPAAEQLRTEGVPVLVPHQAPARVLHIGLVNLMPDKPATETQLARLLGAAPQVSRLHLFWPQGENSRRTPPEHLAFYEPFDSADARALDALIITGAPVEQKPFGEVRYWPQLAALYDSAREQGLPTLNICWAAMAALHHHRGLAKRMLQAKAFGVFDQTVREPTHALMQAMPATFPVPVSRYAHVPLKVLTGAGIGVLATSGETGASIAYDADHDATLLFDHFEYDAGTLLSEFLRDRQAAIATAPPSGVALGGATAVPWRPAAHLLFRNWLAHVERRATVRRPRDLLDWLLAPGVTPRGGATLVAIASPGPGLMTTIGTLAETLAVPLAEMRRHTADQATAVELVLDEGVPEAATDGLVKALLEQPGVARVLRREARARGAEDVAWRLEAAA
jgi:homoserine O-succinyltransferase